MLKKVMNSNNHQTIHIFYFNNYFNKKEKKKMIIIKIKVLVKFFLKRFNICE